MASGLRPRSNVNYKSLHEGESLPLARVRQIAKPVLLEETYFVDRIVSRKETDKKSSYQYLVIWKDYPVWDATWEPENHLSTDVLETFLPTEIASDRLRPFTESFERAVQSRLKCRNPAFSLFLDSDLFRYVFGDVNTKLCEKDDFSKLNLPSNWFYVLDKDGTGRKIKFPMKVSLKLYFRKIYVKINGKLVEKNKPFERLNCFSATESCTLDNVFPLKPQFSLYKVGFKGVFISRSCEPEDLFIYLFVIVVMFCLFVYIGVYRSSQHYLGHF